MKILVALGGNAIKRAKDTGTIEEMTANLARTCKQLAVLVKQSHKLCLTHGNGPQVGQVYARNQKCAPEIPAWPLHVCVAETEGLLGFMFQQQFHNALESNTTHTVVTVVTQTEVLVNDPAFMNPNKPIGNFFSQAEAEAMMKANSGVQFKPDSGGRGWRQVVASPKPVRIVEAVAVNTLCKLENTTVIASGGGGIPVIVAAADSNGMSKITGCDAVVDKDFAAVLLSREAESDLLMLVTDVDYCYVDFGKPTQRALTKIRIDEAKQLVHDGHFAEGSMKPKVEACIEFVEQTRKSAVITSLDNVAMAIDKKMGTWFVI